MSKVKNDAFYGEAFVLSECYLDCIIGRQMEVIEALNLPLKQETSIKELLKKAVYEVHHSEGVQIQNDLNTVIREARRELRIKNDALECPTPFIGVSLKDIK